MRQSIILVFVLMLASCNHSANEFNENTPGLHVLKRYADEHILVTKAPTDSIIKKTILELEWSGFHQVFLVLENGESLEVGGSINPEHGLSSVYRNKNEHLVTEEPPSTVKEMIFILTSFHRGDNQWREKYVYK